MIKKLAVSITTVVIFFSATAAAGQITLTLSDESESGKVRYCFYENSNYSFTHEVPISRSCPFTRTFDTDDDEE